MMVVMLWQRHLRLLCETWAVVRRGKGSGILLLGMLCIVPIWNAVALMEVRVRAVQVQIIILPQPTLDRRAF